MTVSSSYHEVLAAIERLEYSVPDREVRSIAKELDERRRKLRVTKSHCCLGEGGSGVLTWVQSRCNERGLTHPCDGKSATFGDGMTGRFHFWRWDEERFGPWKKDGGIAIESRNAGVKRSPLSRLIDSSPINSIARKIAGEGDKPCPYCNRYFRNPAAMALHIEDVHADACSGRRKSR